MLFSGEVREVLAVSDAIEISAEDMPSLKNAVMQIEGFSSLTEADGMIHVHFKGPVSAGEINSFMFSKGIVLSRISERKRSLEQHFLELLQETYDKAPEN